MHVERKSGGNDYMKVLDMLFSLQLLVVFQYTSYLTSYLKTHDLRL